MRTISFFIIAFYFIRRSSEVKKTGNSDDVNEQDLLENEMKKNHFGELVLHTKGRIINPKDCERYGVFHPKTKSCYAGTPLKCSYHRTKKVFPIKECTYHSDCANKQYCDPKLTICCHYIPSSMFMCPGSQVEWLKSEKAPCEIGFNYTGYCCPKPDYKISIALTEEKEDEKNKSENVYITSNASNSAPTASEEAKQTQQSCERILDNYPIIATCRDGRLVPWYYVIGGYLFPLINGAVIISVIMIMLIYWALNFIKRTSIRNMKNEYLKTVIKQRRVVLSQKYGRNPAL